VNSQRKFPLDSSEDLLIDQQVEDALAATPQERIAAAVRGIAVLSYLPYRTTRDIDVQEMEDSFRRDKIIGTDYYIARLHALLGNSDSSIDWLERSLALRDADVAMVDVDPGFDSLRGNRRFQALLRRMNLPLSATPRRQPTTENRQRPPAVWAATP